MPNCISRTAFRGFLRGWEATACHGAQRRGRSYCSRVRRAGDGVRRAAELSRREFCYHRAGRTRVFSWGCVTCRGRGPVPLFGAAVLGQRGRGGPDLCPWSYRGGGGRGQRSPVCAGKVCVRQPRQGSWRGSGQRDGRGVPSSGASPVLSPSVPARWEGLGRRRRRQW